LNGEIITSLSMRKKRQIFSRLSWISSQGSDSVKIIPDIDKLREGQNV